MIKTKFLKIFLVILGIVTICATGYVAWRINKDIEKVSKEATDFVIQKEKPKAEERKSLKTEINISDWKVYRNEEYGFEIKYPQNLIIEEIKLIEQQSNYVNFWTLEGFGAYKKREISTPLFYISIESVKVDNFENWFKNKYNRSISQYSYSLLNINGNSAYRVIMPGEADGTLGIFLHKDRQIVSIDTFALNSTEGLPLFMSIASTFEFTE